MNRLLALLLFLPLLAHGAQSDATDPTGFELPIEQVLVLGPLPINADLLKDSAKADELRRALVMQLSDSGLPYHDKPVSAFGQTLRWQLAQPSSQTSGEGLWLWAVNLESAAFVQGKLQVAGLKSANVWRNGVSEKDKDGAIELALVNGSHHLLLLHHGRDGDATVSLRWVGKSARDRVTAHVEPKHRVSARLLTNAETVTSLAVSNDGKLAALGFSARNDSAGVDLRRLEIRTLADNRVVQSWTSGQPSALAFSPDDRWLAWREGKHLWLRDLRDGSSRLLLAEHENLGSFRWHPDSRSILFSWTSKFEAKDAKVKRLRALEDRWRTFRDNSQLFQVDIASGLLRPLTQEDSTVSLQDIHPAGDRVLLSQYLVDYKAPPFGLVRLFELSLSSGQTREIASLRQANAVRYADQGYWLLAGAGLAESFASVPAGSNPAGDRDPDSTRTPADLQRARGSSANTEPPNEYDTQLYRLSADGKTLHLMSGEFVPSIGGIELLRNGDLLLPATEADRSPLYRYSPQRERFTQIKTGVDQMDSFVVSGAANPVVLLFGTDVAAPQRVHAVDLSRQRIRVLVDTAATEYAQVELGEVRDFRFNNSSGDQIEGRYYLPPNFDASRKYPLIVFYYGGTSPINRQFTGRYPLHLWAANGYVVYVPQPRGAIGYGKRFSSQHVNAWGEYAADDIIEGTRAFVAQHDFVDGERIGNIGASYGGFMTMYLATRTDLFTASISHAGISAIASYWGQGWWGYGYSGIASRGSYPWNNRELYVDRSPLFSADRINTPLLLLTGDSDTNVPPGESHNMYTALKLLQREVELIEVPGEDHWILDREKRYVWWDTILAWYDRWLKDEPQWWHHLYPETAPKSSE